MVEKIGAHHHLWKYDAREYGWIDSSMGVLQRDFLPCDLERELPIAGVKGTVAVQVRQTLAETSWLLDLAYSSEFIRGVVGWAPIASKNFPADLDRLRDSPSSRGFVTLFKMSSMTISSSNRASTAGLLALRTQGWFTTR